MGNLVKQSSMCVTKESYTFAIHQKNNLLFTLMKASRICLSVLLLLSVHASTATTTNNPSNEPSSVEQTSETEGKVKVIIEVSPGPNFEDITWMIVDKDKNMVTSLSKFSLVGYDSEEKREHVVYLDAGATYSFGAYDIKADGWNGGSYVVRVNNDFVTQKGDKFVSGKYHWETFRVPAN